MRLFIAAMMVLPVACGEDGSKSTCEAGPNRPGYPAAPYGVTEGDVIEDLEFVSSDDTVFLLGDLYHDGTNRLLLLTTAAGWCTACIEEQPKLQALYEANSANGLASIVALFEDASFAPADAALAASWKTQYSLTFPVVADPDFGLSAYYDRSLTPMNMLVDVCTMEIVTITTGSDPSAIEAIIEARL